MIKPLTKRDLAQVVKDQIKALPTKKDVEGIVFNKLSEFHAGMIKPEFKKLDEKIEKVRLEVSFVKDDIKGLKADLSDTPSRKEFNILKRKAEGNPSVNLV